jgi:hypothetical protein
MNDCRFCFGLFDCVDIFFSRLLTRILRSVKSFCSFVTVSSDTFLPPCLLDKYIINRHMLIRFVQNILN